MVCVLLSEFVISAKIAGPQPQLQPQPQPQPQRAVRQGANSGVSWEVGTDGVELRKAANSLRSRQRTPTGGVLSFFLSAAAPGLNKCPWHTDFATLLSASVSKQQCATQHCLARLFPLLPNAQFDAFFSCCSADMLRASQSCPCSWL